MKVVGSEDESCLKQSNIFRIFHTVGVEVLILTSSIRNQESHKIRIELGNFISGNLIDS